MATATLESRGVENSFSEVHGTLQLVSFTLGKELYGIEITKVREIILITEITFFRPEHRKEKIYKFGHMHLDDIIERADKFHNELIIAMHFSTRYATNQIEKAVMKKIPAQLKDRIKLWL